jgi:polar amino acid transport system permease protein
LDIDLVYALQALPALLHGAWVTLAFTVISSCISLVLGTAIAVSRSDGGRAVRFALDAYVSFIRGTPLLVQILLIYYLLPLVGLDLSAAVAGVAALSLSSAAFVSEIVRGGLSSIPKGQIEAARALGLPRVVTWGRVVLPQVGNLIIPPLINEFTLVLKSTPLLSVITVVELMRTATHLFSTNFRPIEMLLGAALIFFVINFTISRIGAAIERRNRLKLA